MAVRQLIRDETDIHHDITWHILSFFNNSRITFNVLLQQVDVAYALRLASIRGADDVVNWT